MVEYIIIRKGVYHHCPYPTFMSILNHIFIFKHVHKLTLSPGNNENKFIRSINIRV